MTFRKPFRRDIQDGTTSPGAIRMGQFIPNAATADSVQRYNLGVCKSDSNGNKYRYVLFEAGTIVPAQGSPVSYVASNDSKVTSDISKSDTGGSRPAGIVMADNVADATYGWILIKGNPEDMGVTVKTDTSVAANEALVHIADSVCDGVDREAANSAGYKIMGSAYIADSGSQLVRCHIDL